MREYTDEEQKAHDAISQMIDELPALFYGRDDNAWEDCVIALHEAVMRSRSADKRQPHSNEE